MVKYDITKTNLAIEKLLAVTENPGIGFSYRRFTATGT